MYKRKINELLNRRESFQLHILKNNPTIYSFLIKLPIAMKGIYLQLYAVFFFLTKAFLNVLYQKKEAKHTLLDFSNVALV